MRILGNNKICPSCKISKPRTLEYFYKDGKNKSGSIKLNGRCIDCCKVRNRTNYQKDPSRAHKRFRKWKDLNPEDYKYRHYVYKFGIAIEEAKRLLDYSTCEVCNSISNICIDHDHTTDNIRGTLCHACNKALGLLQDDPKIVESLLKYIGRFK